MQKIRLADGGRMDIPLQTRLAPVGTVDTKTRTAELVWSRGARIERFDWWNDETYFEELSMDPAHIRLGRLESGAPLLDTHNRYSLEAVLGVVEKASVANGEGRATVRFSERAEVQPIFNDVAAGIVRNVSVGYKVHKYEKSRDANGVLTMRAVDWEPMEISLVPIGADAGAGVRSEQQQHSFPCEIVDPADPAKKTRKEVMNKTPEELAAEEAAKKKVEQERAEQARKDAEAAAKVAAEAAQKAERERVVLITELGTRHALSAEFVQRLITEGKSADQARAAVLDELAKKTTEQTIRSGHSGIDTISDETVNRRALMVGALMHRADPRNKLEEAAKQFRGYTLREMMRKCLELRGVRTDGMSVSQMWERTFTSGSDLPSIVLDAANKSLRQAYEGSPRTFVPWTRQGTAPDFKNINRIVLSGAPALLEVKSGGEFKRGVVSDGKEVYALSTFGRIIGINRQTIINDDMDAFTRLPALCARAAADLESDTVYGILTANAALGDTIALFDATTHKNYTSSGTALSVASLGVGRAAMRAQKGLEGRPINVRPSFLVIPVAIETIGEQYTSADFVSAKSADVNPFRQGKPSALTVVPEARLDATSAVSWYLAADPSAIDTIEYSYLEGQEGVYMETRMGFDIDGMELKVREDFAAKALDYRGLYKNAGA